MEKLNMDELNEGLILSEEEFEAFNLFGNEGTKETPPEEKEKEDTTEDELNPDELFSNPESVGSENKEDNKEEKDTTSTEGSGSSPDSNFYYSIANALVEDGILNLDDEYVKSIDSAEGLAEAIEKQVDLRLDETQKRINDALQANIEPDEIRQYETVLSNLDRITEESITDESEKGENLRKNLIYQDFLNRGFSKERATREVKKSFDSGSDIEDAKDALENNKNYFKSQYENLIKEGKEEAKAEELRIKKEAETLKKQMLEDKEIFDGVSIDKAVRQKAYDNITKPIYRNEEGEYLTAIQKYETENPIEFRKKLGIIFTLTDGFKNLDMLVKGKVNKEVKRNLKELETKLRTNKPSGNITFVGSNDTGSSRSSFMLDI